MKRAATSISMKWSEPKRPAITRPNDRIAYLDVIN